MTVRELKMKHKRERKERKINTLMSLVGGVVLVVGMVVFVNATLNAWDKEIENHGEYNRNYIQQMEMEKTGK